MRQSSRQKLLKQHQRTTHVRRVCYFQANRQEYHHHHYPLSSYQPLMELMQRLSDEGSTISK
ncbi:hypothetical protein HR45_12325 [Shewanella mangrovi]|uniref:Uncharacterized protein n=1 Tax=Shewanella mangrovi TaxID=1515746 RepID=A0A094JXM2_9GAMM|nr:hypothetical protein [Shewanella mangrovi]KFZ37191.1 hypothetical protein HR45_12325 [Shewanella mangrovi]